MTSSDRTISRSFHSMHATARKQGSLGNFYTAYRYYWALRLIDPDNEEIAFEFIQLTIQCYLIAKEEALSKQMKMKKIEQQLAKPLLRTEADLSPGERYVQNRLGLNIVNPLKNLADCKPDVRENYFKIQNLIKTGLHLIYTDDYVEGMKKLDEAVATDPRFPTLMPRSMMHINNNNLDPAKDDFAQALRSDCYRMLHLDQFLVHAGKIALRELALLKIDHPAFPWQELMTIAAKQLQNKNYLSCTHTYTTAMTVPQLHSELASMYSNRGYAHLQLKNYKSALYDFSLAIWLKHPLVVGHYPINPLEDWGYLRQVYVGLGNLTAAINVQRHIQEFFSGHSKKQQEKFKIKPLEEHNKDFSYELLDQALVEIAQQQFSKAKKFLELSIKVWAKNIDAIIELSLALTQTDQIKQARAVLDSAAKIEPHNKRIIFNLKLLNVKSEIEPLNPRNKLRKKDLKKKHKSVPTPAKNKSTPNTIMVDFVKEKEAKAEAELRQIINHLEIDREKRKALKLETKKKAAAIIVKEKIKPINQVKPQPLTEQKSTVAAIQERKQSDDAKKVAEEKERYNRYMQKTLLERAKMAESFAKFNLARLAEAKGSTPIQIKLHKTEEECLSALDFAGVQSYLIGSKVQDHLQGKPFNLRSDIDIVTTASEEEIKRAFPNIHKSPYDNRNFSTYVNGVKVDIRQSEALKESLVADAMARDFTINAIYADKKGKIFDPTKRGINDLDNGPELNTISENAVDSFIKDPIRLLRALHKSINSNVKIPDALMKIIQEQTHLLATLDPNLLHSWLLKVLSNNPQQSFQKLLDMKIIDLLFPNIAMLLRSDKDWILAELQVLEKREMACCLHRFQKETDIKIKKPRKPTPNDLYTIFMISAVKNKIAYQKERNPIHAVVNENRILDSYFNRYSPDSRIIKPLNKRWDQAHRQLPSNPFNLLDITMPLPPENIYSSAQARSSSVGGAVNFFGQVGGVSKSSEVKAESPLPPTFFVGGRGWG